MHQYVLNTTSCYPTPKMAYTSTLSGKKLMNHLSSTLNESAAAPISSFAEKQLQKMGWSKGEGLGKDGTGISTHIKVKKREEGSALGSAGVSGQVRGGFGGEGSVGEGFNPLEEAFRMKRRKELKEEEKAEKKRRKAEGKEGKVSTGKKERKEADKKRKKEQERSLLDGYIAPKH